MQTDCIDHGMTALIDNVTWAYIKFNIKHRPDMKINEAQIQIQINKTDMHKQQQC